MLSYKFFPIKIQRVMSNIFQLQSLFKPAGDQPQAIEKITQHLHEGSFAQTLLGVTGSGKTFTIANVIEKVQKTTIILEPNKTLAAQFYAEMRHFFPNNAVEYFVSYYDYYQPEAYVPTTDTYIEKDASINEHIEQMRLSATKALLERKDTIIVATVSAIYGLGDPEAYLAMVLHVDRNDHINQRNLLRRLAELQYTRNDYELRRGTYRVQGSVLDIYPADEEKNAVRLILEDDVVASIHIFDPLTGEVYSRPPRVTIFPKTHYVTPRQTLLEAIEGIKQELKHRLEELAKNNRLVEYQRLEQRTKFDIEMMLELGYCSGIENYSRYLSKRAAGEPPPTLMDYLPPDALLIIDESHITIPQLRGMYAGDRSRKETLVEYGFRLPSALDNRPLRFDEFERLMPQTIFVSATPGPYEAEKTEHVIELLVRPTGLLDPEVHVRPATIQIDDLLSEIKKRISLQERVLVTTLTKRMAEDLTEYLTEHGVKARYLHSDIETLERVALIRDLRLGLFDALIGINLLREGLDIPEVSLVAILDADKEGFLRSSRALIQTMGRAARHLHGTAILYADQMTPSMAQAIQEANRRREKQQAYNHAHHITARSIQKAITPMIESDYRLKEAPHGLVSTSAVKKSADQQFIDLSPKQLAAKIEKLETEMYQHARHLEFEEAATLRDKISYLRTQLLEMGKNNVG